MSTGYWVEATSLKDRPGQEWAIGRRLWSPTHSRSGADIYRAMRAVHVGDTVLHADVKTRRLLGVSTVATEAWIGTLAEGTRWAGRGMIVDLADYRAFSETLPFAAFLAEEHSPQLERVFADADQLSRETGMPQLFFTRHLSAYGDRKLRQGAYLSQVPVSLIEHIASCARRDASLGDARFNFAHSSECGSRRPGPETTTMPWVLNLFSLAELSDPAVLARLLGALAALTEALAIGAIQDGYRPEADEWILVLRELSTHPLRIEIGISTPSGRNGLPLAAVDQALTRASVAGVTSSTGDRLLAATARLADIAAMLHNAGIDYSLAISAATAATA